MNKIKKRIISSTIIIFFIIFVVSAYILIENFLEIKQVENSNLNLIKEISIEDSNMENSENASGIDWQKLQGINKDIIGWIKIEETNINYPILSDVDSSLHYLNHSYDGKYNKNGSIFTTNKVPFEEDITVIHGHNMKNGIMFSELSKYMNKSFLDNHSTFEIYTQKGNYKATIFSCYSININEEQNNIKNLDFENEIKYYKEKSKYPITNVENIEKIVKLSTCSYFNNSTNPTTQRYYILAKLEVLTKNAENQRYM